MKIYKTSVKTQCIYKQRISTSVFINQSDRSFSNSVRAEGTLSWRSHRSHSKLKVEISTSGSAHTGVLQDHMYMMYTWDITDPRMS